MNVAVVERASAGSSVTSVRDGAPGATQVECEWIDPEGDDWFSAIYRELTSEQDSARPSAAGLELDHWFG